MFKNTIFRRMTALVLTLALAAAAALPGLAVYPMPIQTTRGTLFCAGMIAGEGLVGILLAVFAVFGISTALSIDLGNIGGVVLMIVMIACLLAFSMKKKKN